MNSGRFNGKRVVVFASGFGVKGPEDIGRASAIALAAEGAEVAVVQFTQAAADECVAQITAAGGKAQAYEADPRDPHSLEQLTTNLGSSWGTLDVLVTHHFGTYVASVADTTLEQWEETIRVNLTSVFMATKLFLPMLKKSPKASIVHVGSIDGTLANPNIPAYSASKAGVHILIHSLAGELGHLGIRVNGISRAASTILPLPDNIYRQVNGATPLARAADPSEYAAAVLFLASEEASYITGAILPVDGGRTAVTPGCSPGYKGYLPGA